MTALTTPELRDRLEVIREERLRLSHGGTTAATNLLITDAVIGILEELRCVTGALNDIRSREDTLRAKAFLEFRKTMNIATPSDKMIEEL